MINRDLIRRKIVQLTYAYYQNSDHNMENAEKELMFSLSKSYDLYNYIDRKSVVYGKSVDLGGRRIIKKKESKCGCEG